ncbi:glycerophosphodiester phosphodiesterase family protein [Paenibacillus apiarius]|uniref:Glycerophosphodiester phosphodiesterase n=1 Tax=Paenibacillus apiarius TaxID=46240 RepID=A0ABT4DV81_9BACL|nr:glycerophosphodiester phosphodiesterase family protein [Paenibacillus apiarius]MCY9514864.1 glycerophosphodiester phosphodiesterase [Paenibacillus apiarius]MCY9521256.1 glycerophosphodiester phosphodiesterase [Paenibacillus apiarius]MCY9553972.1 glycerophosphodiester phosphodiesterase [Paenibacillus apiarius]MCY9560346.1 glycerophosphodiester phosphodiesterase [Paenibacillus apiarius]MCY9685696.1 glycerophosphodiester phosphodiesterase [Paenibacillus apiarius]
MKLKKVVRSKVFLFFLFLFLFMYLNNSNLFTNHRSEAPFLLAHRGLAQTFSMEGIEGDTCTAERIHTPEHPYLENTIPSMEAAFEAGADMVEFDIKPTKDGQFAVFHDWTLECRTNVEGMTKDYTMTQLKQIDIGYGYTADNGKTYPFRGKGIGLMPSMEEVLAYFPERSFLIHMKSDDPEEGVQLAQHLAKLSNQRLSLITVYGGDKPVAALKRQLPELRVMSKATLKSCLIPYIAAGWTGYVPSPCEKTQLHIPEKFVPWLWGWPGKFLSRMENAGTRVIVVAGDGGWSEGFDTAEDVKRLPSNYTGGLWTNRIDKIAPLFHKKEIE